MAQFMYPFLTRGKGTNTYIAPNHYQDVKDIHTVNCAFCNKTALVQDVLNWEKTLEYLYRCQLGHEFHIIYFKLHEDDERKGRPKTRKAPMRG